MIGSIQPRQREQDRPVRGIFRVQKRQFRDGPALAARGGRRIPQKCDCFGAGMASPDRLSRLVDRFLLPAHRQKHSDDPPAERFILRIVPFLGHTRRTAIALKAAFTLPRRSHKSPTCS